MAYTSKLSLNTLDENSSFSNAEGSHECVVLAQKVADAPNTGTWKKGKKVLDCTATEISPGTVIATFDHLGKYPSFARHAAIYESHNAIGIKVIDQWKLQGKAKRRTIRLKNSPVRNVDDATWYYIVE